MWKTRWLMGVYRAGIYEFSRKSRLDVFTTSFNVPTRKIPLLLLFLSIASTRGFPITSQTFFFFFFFSSLFFSNQVISLRRFLYIILIPLILIPPINIYFREGGGDLAVFWVSGDIGWKMVGAPLQRDWEGSCSFTSRATCFV